MVDNGLLEEIIALRKEGSRIYGSENVIDHEEGIFQSIGRFCGPRLQDKASDQNLYSQVTKNSPASQPTHSPLHIHFSHLR